MVGRERKRERERSGDKQREESEGKGGGIERIIRIARDRAKRVGKTGRQN